MQTEAPASPQSLPPGPKSWIPFSQLAAFRRDPARHLAKLRREHGDIVFLHLGGQDVYFVSDPELVKDVLVTHHSNFIKSRVLQRSKVLLGEGLLTSEGEFHLRQRRLAQPAFHRDRLVGYSTSMSALSVRTRDRWAHGETRDIAEEMMRLTLAIVAKTLFDSDVDDASDEIGQAVTDLLGLFGIVLLPFSNILQKMPLPSVRRFERSRDTLDRTIYGIIGERRASGRDRGDLLSMLLLAQDEDGTGRMTDKQIRDESLTLFVAGHETTANALAWTWYLLSQNPDAEAKFHEELDQVLGGTPGCTDGGGGRVPEFSDLPRLKYTEMVLAESMRLYPPAWAIGRQAKGRYRLGKYDLKAGSIILMSPYVMHRHPDHWFEPDRFDPDRWLPERVALAARPKFAYFPFGGGPRLCIGERFAWMEGVLVLATLGRKWRLRLDPEQRIDLLAQITLRPRYGMRMRIEAR